MKALITTLFILLFAIPASADALRFVWDYTEEATAIIDGFRIYQEGEPLPNVILPTARTVETAYIKDRQARNYYLVAFSGDEMSGPSDVVTVPAFFANIPRVLQGTFRFEIIEE